MTNVACPECGQVFGPRGLPIHRGRKHRDRPRPDWADRLAEALIAELRARDMRFYDKPPDHPDGDVGDIVDKVLRRLGLR